MAGRPKANTAPKAGTKVIVKETEVTTGKIEVEQPASKESFLTACIIYGGIDIPNYGRLTEMTYKKAIITAKDLDAAYEKFKA